MKINFLLVGFLLFLINNPLYACDIVNKRNAELGGKKGVAGKCSNNGLNIECYVLGESNGGLTCDGPEGNNSGYNLHDLINNVCGCPAANDQEKTIEEQMNQELE